MQRPSSLVLLCLAMLAFEVRAAELNGFVLEPATVEVTEILPGGPPRDGIPALDSPPRSPPRVRLGTTTSG